MIIRLHLFILHYAVATRAAGYGNCPFGCECLPHHSQPSSWQSNCMWETLPEGAPFAVSTSIRSLSIQCSSINDTRPLEAVSFKGLNDLHELRIEGCAISRIHSAAFNPLKSLREFYLDRVSSDPFSLPEDSLLPLSRLQKLHVTNSNLQSLPSSLFCTLSNLQMLNVSGNALRESSLSTNSACHAAHLIIVDLSRNNIKEILANSFDAFPAVRQLLLGENGLSSMHSQAFNHTALLQNIGLEKNELKTIGDLPDTVVSINAGWNIFSSIPSSISSLPSLVFLNLSFNLLTSPLPQLTTEDLETLDLSHNFLNSLPFLTNASASSLLHLLLSHNNISFLPAGPLSKFGLLQTLDLSSNGLAVIEEEALKPLMSLSTLQLSNNSLSIIAPSSLADLTLESIDLSRNKLPGVPLGLSRLARCRNLDLSHNEIFAISHFVLSRVPQLTKLNLSGNKLEKIEQHDVSDCPHLTSLSLSSNLLRSISPSAFIKCDSLRRLDLSSNRIQAVALATGLNSLRHLNLSSNLLGDVNWDALPAKVEWLQLGHNRIVKMRGSPAHHRTRHLSLSHNSLTSLSSSSLPDGLESLDLSSNSIVQLAPSTFASKAALTQVNLSSNQLRSFSFDSIHVPDAVTPVSIQLQGNPLSCTCEMEWIKTQRDNPKPQVVVSDASLTECLHSVDGRRLRLDQVDKKDLLCNYTKTCEPSCGCCQFSTCDCHSICPIGCQCWRDSPHKINIVKCNALGPHDAKNFSTRNVPMSATHVYISSFPLHSLQQHAFLSRDKLIHLHINNTGLRTVDKMAFNKVTSLQLLDLSGNELKELRGESLFRTGNITHLFLDHNKIKNVDEGLLEKLPNLQALTLHSNALTDIPPTLSSVSSVSLADNFFRCDCDLDRFNAPRFLHSHYDKVRDAPRMRCFENVTRAFRENDTTVLSAFPPNRGDDVYEMSMQEFLRELNSSICVPVSTGIFGGEPQSSLLLILLGLFILLLCLAFICLLIAAVRRISTALRSRRYNLDSSLNCSTTPGISPHPPLLSHDVFISYSKKDEKLVEEKLLRRLENDGHSVLMLHRDGARYDTHGHYVINYDLSDQMKTCSTVVVFITHNFLENEWNNPQMRVNHTLVAKENKGSPRFVSVFGDGVNMNDLESNLGNLVRVNTMLKLSDHLFWNLLPNCLPMPLARHSPIADSDSHYSACYGTVVPSEIV